MKLKIKNTSSYRTDDLRKLITLALKEEGMWSAGGSYFVQVRDCKGNRCHGLGWYNTSQFLLSLPTYYGPSGQRKKYAQELPDLGVAQLARVAIHEIGHTKGLHHEDMVNYWDIEVPWAHGLVIRVAEKAKPKVVTMDARIEARAKKADAKIVEIEGKLRELSNREKALWKRLRGWRRKQRYYLKKAADPKPERVVEISQAQALTRTDRTDH